MKDTLFGLEIVITSDVKPGTIQLNPEDVRMVLYLHHSHSVPVKIENK